MALYFHDRKAPKFAKKLLFAGGYVRLYDHFKNGSLGIVSAFKSNRDLNTNLGKQWELCQRVREMGYGYMPVICQWKGIEERSIIIPNISKDKVHSLAAEFDQDAYLWATNGTWWVWDTKNESLLASGVTLHLVGADEEFINYSRTKEKNS